MPQGTRQQSETERDEAISKALGITGGASSFAALLGLPVAEFVRQQVFGNDVLKGMANNRAGKDLEKVGGSGLSRQKIATEKTVTPPTKKKPGVITPSKKVPIKRLVRESASDRGLQKQMQALVQKELDRLGLLTGKVTQTADYALNPNATNKSINRNALKVEKTAGAASNAEYPKKVEDFNFAQQAVADAEAKAAAARGEFVQGYKDLDQAKTAVNPSPSATEQGVMDALAKKLNDPAVKRQRDSLLAQRRRLMADLGPKPKAGRTKQSRELLANWNAKNSQVEAVTEQISRMDSVIAPSGTLRPQTSNILTSDPMSVTKAVAGNMGSPLTSFSDEQLDSIRQGIDLSPLKENVDMAGREYGRAQGELFSAQRDPRNIEPQFYSPTRGQAFVPEGIGPGMPQKLVDFEVPNPGPFSLAPRQISPFPFPSPMGVEGRGTSNTGAVFPSREPSPQITIDDLIDPTGFRRDLQSYNVAAKKIVPDYGNEQAVVNTARLMGNASIKSGAAPKERPLIDRVISLLQGGTVSPSSASNAANAAQTSASNAVATKQFAAINKGKAPDLSNADDVAQLQKFGWSDPASVKQGSLIGNAENDIVSTRKIDVPRSRIGMNSAAAKAAETLGLGKGFGSRSFNPDLLPGKPNLGKLAKVGMGTSALATGGVMGYNYLTGLATEKQAKAEAAKAAGAKTESKKSKLSIAERARSSWFGNMVERPENLKVPGSKLYDQLVLEAQQNGIASRLTPEEWKQLQTEWFTLAKARDRKK